MVKRVATQLIEKGFVTRGYLGVQLQEVSGDRVVATWTAGEHLHQPYGIVHGGTYVPPQAMGAVPQLKTPRNLADLGITERQADVLRLVCKGLSNLEIARQLSIAENTVKQHAHAAYRALGYRLGAYVTTTSDSHGLKTRSSYDNRFGRVVSTTDPVGAKTSYAYDAASNVISETRPRGQGRTGRRYPASLRQHRRPSGGR